MIGSFLFASLWISSSLIWLVWDEAGHSSDEPWRNFGPFHHVFQVISPFAVSPRKGISAGLTSPGQCLHDSFGVRRWISSTRSPKYCFMLARSLSNTKLAWNQSTKQQKFHCQETSICSRDGTKWELLTVLNGELSVSWSVPFLLLKRPADPPLDHCCRYSSQRRLRLKHFQMHRKSHGLVGKVTTRNSITIGHF